MTTTTTTTTVDALPTRRYLAVDADAHVVEPADLWTSRVAPARSGDVPHVIYNESKMRHEWYIGDEYLTLAPAGAVAGWRKPPPANPRSFEEAHPGALDVHERLKVMDDQGIWAEVLYPNVGGFGSGQFMKIEDVGLRNECVRAYNDFLIDWTSAAPDRFVNVCAVPFWDVKTCVDEVTRAHSIGHRAVLFTGKPDVWWGQPHIADPYWTPLWDVATELGLSISLHAGGGDPALGWRKSGYRGLPPRTRFTATSIGEFFGSAQTITDLIFGGVLERHPALEFAVVEGGIGWVPFLLELMDYQFVENRVEEVSPELRMLPSEYFRRQVYSCFWFERLGPARLLDAIGADHVLFETDFPHPTSLWPPDKVVEQAQTSLSDQSTAVQRKVFFENAARLYHLLIPENQMAWAEADE
jgi:predicted TIM-barrel fold metal-dependent hydrolase